MVKVECDGCGSPYTVSEKRIPEGGLKMRCPKCGATFLVTRDGKAAAGAPAAAATPKPAAPVTKLAAPAVAPKPRTQGDDVDLPAPAEDAALPALAAGGPRGAARAPRPPAAKPAPQPRQPAPLEDEFDLPAPPPMAGEGELGGDLDLPVRSIGEARPRRSADDDLPVVFDDGGALPSPAGDRNLPARARKPADAAPAATAPARGRASTAVGLGSTMRSLGAPPPPAAKPPIFTRRTQGFEEAPGALGGDGFGVLDLGLPGAAEAPAAPRGGRIPRAQQGTEADLPMPGDADLPALLEGDLPLLADGNLPTLAEAGLPMRAEGNLPSLAEAGLPMRAEAGLPAVSAGNLPLAQAAALPALFAGNYPVVQPADLPTVSGGNLPADPQPGLPAAAPAAAQRARPVAYGEALEEPRDEEPFPHPAPPQKPGGAGMEIGLDDLPSESAFPADPAAGSELRLGPATSEAVEFGETESERIGVGGEYEIEAAERQTGGSADAMLTAGGGAAAEDEAPLVQLAPKRSRALRIVAVAVALLAIGGGLLSLTPLGAFGYYAIGDAVNRTKHEQALDEERKRAQTELEEDTAAAAKAALEQAKRARSQMPRYAPMANYTAYLAFAKSLRFGSDSQDKALGKQVLDALGAKEPGDLQTLARAAGDAVDGQLARARQAIEGLGVSRPNDIDVAVLAGEIALSAKTAKPALQLWAQAVKLKKSARTLFGLARAQLAAGELVEAEKTAREVIQLSPKHAGARTLAAGVLWGELAREQEAVKLLEEITNREGPVGSAASSNELATAHCQLGEIHLARSRMTAAEKEFAAALKLEPQAEPALVGNGELFYRSGRYSEALARFEAALRVSPDSVDAKIGTAKTWLAQERAKDAKELMQKVVAAGSKDPLVSYWQGQAEEAQGSRPAAEASYRRAVRDGGADPRAVSAYVALANLLTSQGKGEEANTVLAEASSRLPKSPQLALAKGEVALQAGRLDEAKSEFRRAIELDPQNLGSKFKLGVGLRRGREFDAATKMFDEVSKIDSEYPGLALEWGLLYEATGQTERALQMYNEALKKAPNDLDLKLRVGSTQVVSGQAKVAIPLLVEVLTARPESAEANHYLGRAKLVLHTNLSDAMRLLKRATEADSNRAEYFLYYGWAANDAGQPGEAEKALNRALELDKNLGDIYWQRGVLLQKRGATRDALEELKIALEKKPSRIEAYATMALCYFDQSDLAAAERAWRKAIAGNGDVAEWHYRLGKILAQKGTGGEVVSELTRAVDLVEQGEGGATPSWLHDAHFLLAEAIRTSNPDKARTHYQRFLELAPSDNAYRRDAERALEQLKAPRP